MEELQRTMEATRGHLQNQLKNKEGENNRLSVRLRVGLLFATLTTYMFHHMIDHLFDARKFEMALDF